MNSYVNLINELCLLDYDTRNSKLAKLANEHIKKRCKLRWFHTFFLCVKVMKEMQSIKGFLKTVQCKFYKKSYKKF